MNGATMSGTLPRDARLTPVRADLAAAHLRGLVDAPRFVEGRLMGVRSPISALRRAPAHDAPLETQGLYGEMVTIYDIAGDWAWGQLNTDGYVGYMPVAGLAKVDIDKAERAATHRVETLSTFVFPQADIKAPPLMALPYGAQLAVTHEADGFAVLADATGFVWARHLQPLNMHAVDPVSIAERFVGVPYLWGGRSAFGIDCSGLVQTAYAACGVALPRDSDLQARDAGDSLSLETALKRGDLVFWKGHVGLMMDSTTLLHANAHHMLVAKEPLSEAVARIKAKGGGEITAVRRVLPQ
jgi:cell wall-associated NlpC family hydrolase